MVSAMMSQAGLSPEIVKVVTSGDKGQREILGAFVGELEQAVQDGSVDCGLHCLKDMPTGERAGLEIAAYLPREDARDALLTEFASIHELPVNSVIGTGSLRRSAQIRKIRPDLQFKPLVGNVDTRLRKLKEGEYQAIVLAMAGLKRLDLTAESLEVNVIPFELNEVVPAAGQAVLVLQVRANDALTEPLRAFNDQTVQAASLAERTFLGQFGTGCSLPIGAHAEASGSQVVFQGRVLSPDGTTCLDGEEVSTPHLAAEAGMRLATQFKERGAMEILGGIVRA